MSAHGKLRLREDGVWVFFCPGCNNHHGFKVGPNGWQFDQNFEKPTVTPSVMTTGGENPNYRCHLAITAGQIQFYDDSTHDLKGQTVPMRNEQ